MTTAIESEVLLADYQANGFVVAPGVFTAAETDEAIAAAMAHVEGGGIMKEVDASAPRKIVTPFLVKPAFRKFPLHDRLREVLTTLLGARPMFITDQIFMKPPRHGSPKPWHQDGAYFITNPQSALITAWIALDDADADNGCLRYIRGSHKDDILPHVADPKETYNLAPPDELIDFSRETPACVPKGGVVFHHGNMLHTSGPNTTDRWRRAYATHWVAEGAEISENMKRIAYYLRDDFAALCAA